MFRIFSSILFLFVVSIAKAQVDSIPFEVKAFTVQGFEPLDYIKGDLNGDKKQDAILILKQAGEDTVMDENLIRPFLLLIRQPDGKLKQIVRNDQLIMCRQCGGVFGDPYGGVVLFPGGFDVHFYGGSSWRWAYKYRFTYKPLKKQWYLTNDQESNFQAGDPEKTMKTINIKEAELAGDVTVENFSSIANYEEFNWKVIAAKTYFYDSPQIGSKPRKAYLLKGNIAANIREFKNFVEVSYDNGKGAISTGFILKKDLVKVK